MSTPYISEIRVFAGNFAPQGWLLCQGQILPISSYETLFNLIGTTFGGDGQNTFALPDLRGTLALHTGTSSSGTNYIMGQTVGTEGVALTAAQMPVHNHSVNCSSAGSTQSGVATQTTPGGNFPGTESSGAGIYETSADTFMNAGMIGTAGASPATPHENRQPYLALNFIIAWEGVYPSRS